MKALEKDRNRRYETANGFAADVQRYLADEPVQACPPSAGYRLPQVRPAEPAGSAGRGGAAAGGAADRGGGAGRRVAPLVWGASKNRQPTAEESRAASGDRAKEELRRDSYFHRISLAHRDLSADNLGRALKLLDECPEDLREWEWHYLMRLCEVEPLVLRDKTEVIGLAFSPDGERLASAGGDGIVKIWNSRTGKVIQTFPAHTTAPTDSVVCVAFHPDG